MIFNETRKQKKNKLFFKTLQNIKPQNLSYAEIGSIQIAEDRGIYAQL